jgi:hypothetical protein
MVVSIVTRAKPTLEKIPDYQQLFYLPVSGEWTKEKF